MRPATPPPEAHDLRDGATILRERARTALDEGRGLRAAGRPSEALARLDAAMYLDARVPGLQALRAACLGALAHAPGAAPGKESRHAS